MTPGDPEAGLLADARVPVRGPGGRWFSGDGAWVWNGKRWTRTSQSERRLFNIGPYAVAFGEGRWLPQGMPVISRYAPASALNSQTSPGAAWAKASAAGEPLPALVAMSLRRGRGARVLGFLAATSVGVLVLLTIFSAAATIGISLPAAGASHGRMPVSTSSTETQMLQTAQRSVVTVRAEQPGGQSVSGSGFFISSDGRLLTNAHVVEHAVAVVVVTPDGQPHTVSRVAVDTALDVAELASGMAASPIHLAGNALLPGNTIYLLGNPGGDSPNSTAKGHVVAVHQRMQSADGRNYPDMIATDASVVGGNSGGPALNSKGELVGIATLGQIGSLNGSVIPNERFRPALAGWTVVTPIAYPPSPSVATPTASCGAAQCMITTAVTNYGGNGYVGLRFDLSIGGTTMGSCTGRQMVGPNQRANISCVAAWNASQFRGRQPDGVSAHLVEVTAA